VAPAPDLIPAEVHEETWPETLIPVGTSSGGTSLRPDNSAPRAVMRSFKLFPSALLYPCTFFLRLAYHDGDSASVPFTDVYW